MMRAPIIEISIPRLRIQRPQYPTHEVVTEQGGFSILERPTRAVFTLQNPRVVYTDRFAINAAIYLNQGKYVEVECKTDTTLVQELQEGSPKANIDVYQVQLSQEHDKKVVAHTEQNRQPGMSGWVLPRETSVIYRRITNENARFTGPTQSSLTQSTAHALTPFVNAFDSTAADDELAAAIEGFLNDHSEHVRPVWEDSYVINIGSSLVLGEQLPRVMRFLDNALAVNIPTTIFSGRHDPDGIFIERDFVSEETVIDLNNNHNNAQLLEGVVIPLTTELLQRGETVVIDYSQQTLDETNVIFSYFDILQSSPFIDISIEARESADGNTKPPHNCVVLKPGTITT